MNPKLGELVMFVHCKHATSSLIYNWADKII